MPTLPVLTLRPPLTDSALPELAIEDATTEILLREGRFAFTSSVAEVTLELSAFIHSIEDEPTCAELADLDRIISLGDVARDIERARFPRRAARRAK